jgi:protein involved in polysaccharide export with SLBB domain
MVLFWQTLPIGSEKMERKGQRVLWRLLAILASGSLLVPAGCRAVDLYSPTLVPPVSADAQPPREQSMVSLPAYRIQPPDVVRLDITKLVPRPSYRIDSGDMLEIRVAGIPSDAEPIDGYYAVSDMGLVTLGPLYGVVPGRGLTVRVMGLTTQQAAEQIVKALRLSLQYPRASVSLARSASIEDLSGVYAVQPDGLVVLQNYGAVHLAGKTVTEARRAVENCLARYFDSPRVAVSISAYSSAGYYVIVTGTVATPETVFRYPITGKETVLDALAQPQIGRIALSSRTLWLARPGRCGIEQIMPIDWNGIARGGETATNYQILPGDRLYIVNEAVVVAADFIGTVGAPLQGLMALGSNGVSTLQGMNSLGRGYNTTRPESGQ